METLWKLLCFILGLTLELCNGLPINLENAGADSNDRVLLILLAVALFACITVLVIACTCCDHNKNGFTEFRDSPVVASVASNLDHGHVNPIANGEFTIFTPISPAHHSDNVFAANQRILNLTPEDYKYGNIDVSSWFDESEKDFPRTRLKYIRELGMGWFGKIVEGTAQGLNEEPSEPDWTPVVVRILEASASTKERVLFLHDADVYRCGYHPNLLRLLGRCLDTTPLLLLQEYCAEGDLKRYLRNSKAKCNELFISGLPLVWCYQLSTAIKFLHDQQIAHPDLASRNCQLTNDLTLKLGDYGLHTSLYPEDYYQGSPAIPLRWCAPEIILYTNTTIQSKKVSLESNVWSLGVTMWEILECGEQPYSNLTDDEVISQVLGAANVRLSRPNCKVIYSDYIYKLMQSCWSTPELRPSALQIDLMITDLVQVYERTKLSSNNGPESMDFDRRWESFKPNNANSITDETPLIGRDDDGVVSPNQKSPSLTNLHGSLDNLLKSHNPMDSWLENNTGGEPATTNDTSSSETSLDPSPCPLHFRVATRPPNAASSGSETEDENWKRKIESGAYTEKVRQKSRSVADLMVLTHVDCSESDTETLPSLSDFKQSFLYQKSDVRMRKNVEKNKFGSEGNLLSVHDAFQDELRKLQEERRDSLLFVPDKCTRGCVGDPKLSNDSDMLSNDSKYSDESSGGRQLNTLESIPVKKLIEELNSPKEIVPPKQVYNVFNFSVKHINNSVDYTDINKDSFTINANEEFGVDKPGVDCDSVGTSKRQYDHINPSKASSLRRNVQNSNEETDINNSLISFGMENCGNLKEFDFNEDGYKYDTYKADTDTYMDTFKNDTLEENTFNANTYQFSCNSLKHPTTLLENLHDFHVKIEVLSDQSTPVDEGAAVTSQEELDLDRPSSSEDFVSKDASKKCSVRTIGDKTVEECFLNDVIDKDSGLNTPENSASLEKLYDEIEEILDEPAVLKKCPNCSVTIEEDYAGTFNSDKGKPKDIHLIGEEVKGSSEGSGCEEDSGTGASSKEVQSVDDDLSAKSLEDALDNLNNDYCQRRAKILCESFLANEKCSYYNEKSYYRNHEICFGLYETTAIDSDTKENSTDKTRLSDNSNKIRIVEIIPKAMPDLLSELPKFNTSKEEKNSKFDGEFDTLQFHRVNKELHQNQSENFSKNMMQEQNKFILEDAAGDISKTLEPFASSNLNAIKMTIEELQHPVASLFEMKMSPTSDNARIKKEHDIITLNSVETENENVPTISENSDSKTIGIITATNNIESNDEKQNIVLLESKEDSNNLDTLTSYTVAGRDKKQMIKSKEINQFHRDETLEPRTLEVTETSATTESADDSDMESQEFISNESTSHQKKIFTCQTVYHEEGNGAEDIELNTPPPAFDCPSPDSSQMSEFKTASEYSNTVETNQNEAMAVYDSLPNTLLDVSSDMRTSEDSDSSRTIGGGDSDFDLNNLDDAVVKFLDDGINKNEEENDQVYEVKTDEIRNIEINKTLRMNEENFTKEVLKKIEDFLETEKVNYNDEWPRVKFDVSDTQTELSPNSLTHFQIFTSTPCVKRRSLESTVILGASDDYSIDYYSGLKTAVDPVLTSEEMKFTLKFSQDEPNDLYSLDAWDNFLRKSFDEHENDADLIDFNQGPHSLLFLDNDDSLNGEDLTKNLQISAVVNENYIPEITTGENDETFDVGVVTDVTFNKGDGTFIKGDETFAKKGDEEVINSTFTKETEKPSGWEAGVGWFLHPQSNPEDLSGQIAVTQEPPADSYIGFSMDDEIMTAIRNELLTKLPHAQRASSDQIDANDDPEPAEKNEVFIRYNVPLSPIPEESYVDSDDDYYVPSSLRMNATGIDSDDYDEDDSSDWSIQDNILTEIHPIDETVGTSDEKKDGNDGNTSSTIDEDDKNILVHNNAHLTVDDGVSSREHNVPPLNSPEDRPWKELKASFRNFDGTNSKYVAKLPMKNAETEYEGEPVTDLDDQGADGGDIDKKYEEGEGQISDEDIDKILMEENNRSDDDDDDDDNAKEIEEGKVEDTHEYENAWIADTIYANMPAERAKEIDYVNAKEIESRPVDQDEEETIEDVYGPLADIRFSGPGSLQIMSTSFNEGNENEERDWDSGSDTRSSSSSGEFIWRDGDHEASLKALDAAPQPQNTQEVIPMKDIREEDESDSGSDGEDCPEFVPSAWDKYATPAKSAMRSPEKTLERGDLKDRKAKGVSFKKQKYHCIYEYPREPDSPILQSYDLWKPATDYATLAAPSVLDKDFFMGATSKPFEMLSGLSSQFFPGKQFPNHWCDNATPDSGVEDITPASSDSGRTISPLPTLKELASLAMRRNRKELGGLRHTRSKLKLDLPPSPSAFTGNATFNVSEAVAAAAAVAPKQLSAPTFSTFGKPSRFLVQHVATPPDDDKSTNKNVSFEALPYKPVTKNVTKFEVSNHPIESVRGEASLLDCNDEDCGTISCINEKQNKVDT